MDIDEEAIGAWPNVALVPGTHEHAATGERVAQPQRTAAGAPDPRDEPWLVDEWEMEDGRIVAIVKGGVRFVREQAPGIREDRGEGGDPRDALYGDARRIKGMEAAMARTIQFPREPEEGYDAEEQSREALP